MWVLKSARTLHDTLKWFLLKHPAQVDQCAGSPRVKMASKAAASSPLASSAGIKSTSDADRTPIPSSAARLI